MIDSKTVLVCDMVLDRYLDVLAEHPDAMTPEFKRMIVDASMDLKREREDAFMGFRRALVAVPTETDEASLLSAIARG